MQFHQQLILGLLAATASSARSIGAKPEAIPYGIYAMSLDAHGAQQLTYMSPGNTSAPHSMLQARATNGAVCGPVQANPGDVANAESALANFFGEGTSFFSLSVSAFSGDAVAYGCDHGRGQEMYSEELLGYMAVLHSHCGRGNEGYYNLPGKKASYGRTERSHSFC